MKIMVKNLITHRVDYNFFKNNICLLNSGLLKNKKKLPKWVDILPDIFGKKKIKQQSIDYIAKLSSKILISLSKNLGSFHKTTSDKKYWGVILYYWLFFYLCTLYRQWLVIDSVKKKHNILQYTYNLDDFYPRDSLEAHHFLVQQSWNSKLIVDIVNSKNIKFFNVVCQKQKIRINKIIYNSNLYKITLKDIFKKLISLLQKNNSFFFFDDYIPTSLKIKLYNSLGQGIYLDNKKFIKNFKAPECKINYNFRKKKLNFSIINSFEDFVSKRILSDIPKSFIENFSFFIKLSNDNLSPKFIFTSNSYRSNDYFKIWAAEKYKINQSKIIFVAHGLEHLNPLQEKESKFCFRKIKFEATSKKNEIQLPFSWYYKKINLRNNNNKKNKNLLLLFNSDPTFHTVIQLGNNNSMEERLDMFRNIKDFLNKFKNRYSNKILVREILEDKKNTTEYYYFKNFFGKKISYSNTKKTSLEEDFSNTNVSIALQLSTFTLQSMHAVPTLIFLTKGHVVEKKYRFINKELQKNNILFYDQKKMFNHITKIFPNPALWWESADVVKARNIFYKTYGYKDKNTSEKWLDFCKSLL